MTPGAWRKLLIQAAPWLIFGLSVAVLAALCMWTIVAAFLRAVMQALAGASP